jgi:hypothetical protein
MKRATAERSAASARRLDLTVASFADDSRIELIAASASARMIIVVDEIVAAMGGIALTALAIFVPRNIAQSPAASFYSQMKLLGNRDLALVYPSERGGIRRYVRNLHVPGALSQCASKRQFWWSSRFGASLVRDPSDHAGRCRESRPSGCP